ncbi:hypothetical protein PN497_14735 [Sphaerospermopsis kisseleviana CS-549]|uniref:Glycosyl transferase n=1 Tax=Sphaerospermopsis kisseleviana CS-549 TaxID=3021783 RepID=A0ABT4ZT67_9CYAN|nr:hypothetical protein [Sphaerospermopsis kisseleviana]MDB9442610.1 hypothetical protein [Sphaerospermopsis kisseleviana CS-549]BAZ82012.1 hypothetical protein NIES73_32820 [Sphaerospermopsis kisseleviana NIES-73]
MVNIGYHSAKLQGQIIRSLYTKAIKQIVNRPIHQNRKVNITVYSFSCQRDLPIQVANIRSFIRHVGIPHKFTVISDGSYLPESCELLSQINPCVDVVEWKDLVQGDIPKPISNYALHHPNRAIMAFWRRLAVLTSITIQQPTIYTDADILFFPGGEEIINLCQSDDKSPWYLPDCLPSLDQRILLHEHEKLNPVNAGFFILKQQINWQESLQRVEQLVDTPVYFTEQTVVHLAMHNSQAQPLAKDKFILSNDDQFKYLDHFDRQKIALRHYVNDVRHKFWLNLAN